MTDLIYDCDRSRLGPALAARFVPITRDAELEDWLAHWTVRPNGWFKTHLGEVLSSFVSSYDAHGLLGSYPMHLLSSANWRDLLSDQHFASLLDVGAGAGYVTDGARSSFDEIVCTETSPTLRRRLLARGFLVPELDLTVQSLERRFDVVSCLNVLDRTARPLTLLRQLIAHLEPGGRLLLSMPLPARAHVHVKGGTIAQSERLPTLAADWETAARELSERMIEPAGLQIERLARAPYLSRGDLHAALYVLDAALWVCTRA
ncbi:MAG: hypothetical protein JWN04_150 [Myxococcaceae bacterium]|nr:hypothetical protein [Myxococcaceae bacterium]